MNNECEIPSSTVMHGIVPCTRLFVHSFPEVVQLHLEEQSCFPCPQYPEENIHQLGKQSCLPQRNILKHQQYKEITPYRNSMLDSNLFNFGFQIGNLFSCFVYQCSTLFHLGNLGLHNRQIFVNNLHRISHHSYATQVRVGMEGCEQLTGSNAGMETGGDTPFALDSAA